MSSVLTSSRIERVCEQCGKTIYPGELYLNRPRTNYPIRCQECYYTTYHQWEENVKNHRNKLDDLISLLQLGPISEIELKKLTGNRHREYIKKLTSLGNLSISKRDGQVYYEITAMDDSDPDGLLDSLYSATIISILNYLLSNTGYNIRHGNITINNKSYHISMQTNSDSPEDSFIIRYDEILLCGISDNLTSFSDFFSIVIPNKIDNMLRALLCDIQ